MVSVDVIVCVFKLDLAWLLEHMLHPYSPFLPPVFHSRNTGRLALIQAVSFPISQLNAYTDRVSRCLPSCRFQAHRLGLFRRQRLDRCVPDCHPCPDAVGIELEDDQEGCCYYCARRRYLCSCLCHHQECVCASCKLSYPNKAKTPPLIHSRTPSTVHNLPELGVHVKPSSLSLQPTFLYYSPFSEPGSHLYSEA